jgi:hypothetical protein
MEEERERFTVEVTEKKDPTPKQLGPLKPPAPEPRTPKHSSAEQPWYEDTDTLILVTVAIILLIIALTIIPFVPPPP